jgi:hypothetical protein
MRDGGTDKTASATLSRKQQIITTVRAYTRERDGDFVSLCISIEVQGTTLVLHHFNDGLSSFFGAIEDLRMTELKNVIHVIQGLVLTDWGQKAFVVSLGKGRFRA